MQEVHPNPSVSLRVQSYAGTARTKLRASRYRKRLKTQEAESLCLRLGSLAEDQRSPIHWEPNMLNHQLNIHINVYYLLKIFVKLIS